MAQITPFRVSVPDNAIKSLKEKLNAATFFEEIEFSDDLELRRNAKRHQAIGKLLSKWVRLAGSRSRA